MWSQIKSFLQTIPTRLYGSHIEAGEEFTSLSSKARFPADDLLERRIKAAREAMGPVEPKPVRMVLENPDTFNKPRDVPEDSFPIG